MTSFWPFDRHNRRLEAEQRAARDLEVAEALTRGRREGQEAARAISDNALDAVIRADSGARITGWNHEAERMFGWTAVEIIGQSARDTLLPARYHPIFDGWLPRVAETESVPMPGQRFEITALRRDGSEFPIELALLILRGDALHFCAFIHDLSDRRRRDDPALAAEAAPSRDALLSTLSHELRTPLQAMLGWTRLLASGRLDPDQTRHGLDIIARNVTQQKRVIEDLLGVPASERSNAPETHGAAAAERVAEQSLAGCRILVVDDEPNGCELLDQIFREHGAHVLSARSAREALEGFLQFRPQVMVSDIGMLETDGYALMRQIRMLEERRADARGAAVVAIALTAFARPEDRETALRAGFNAHLAKPVEPQDLVATVLRLIPDAPDMACL